MAAPKKSSIDTATVSDLANILKETDLTEIEVEQGELRIRVSREPAPQYVSHSAPAVAAAPVASAPAAAPVAAVAPAAVESTASAAGNEVPAPMVGTIYLASAPGADPFVKVGQQVKEGDTLLIIEAMKVMNQIPSPVSGTVKELLVSDGDPVEYGQPIIVVE